MSENLTQKKIKDIIPWMESARTLYLLEALLVQSGNLNVLLLEQLKTTRQRIGDLQVIVFRGAARTRVVKRDLHLTDGGNHLLGFGDHLLLLGGDQTDLVVEGLG